MRNLEEREQALNMYFHEGKGCGEIAHTLVLSLNTVKSWVRRYRVENEISIRAKAPLSKEPICKESLHARKMKNDNSPEARIARLEMEVDLLRNFLILTEEE